MIQYVSKNKYKVTIECGIVEGKRKRISRTIIGTKQEAKLLETDLIKKVKNGNFLNEEATKKLTFKELADMFIKDYCETNLKENTIYGYKSLLNITLKELGIIKIEDITSYVLQHFYNKLKNKYNYSSNTIRHYYVLINDIFECAIKWQLMENNPNSRLEKPKLEKKEAKIYDYTQLKELLDALRNESIDYQAPIILCLDSGMRREELNGLKWENIDFNTNEITIKEVRLCVGKKIVIDTPKTEKSKRKIVVSDITIKYLKELKIYQEEMKSKLKNKWHEIGYVFVNDKGEPYYPDTLSKMFKKIQKKYDLANLTLHQLRHTSASILINNNEDIATVSKRLGHSNINTTLSTYTHVIDEANIKIANTMNKILKNI